MRTPKADEVAATSQTQEFIDFLKSEAVSTASRLSLSSNLSDRIKKTDTERHNIMNFQPDTHSCAAYVLVINDH